MADAVVAAWREMMAELAERGEGEAYLVVTDEGGARVRLSLFDRASAPLGISRLAGDDIRPLATGAVAESLVARGWAEPAGGGGAFRVTPEGRSA